MSKDFIEIAHDVIGGVGLLQQAEPNTMKAFWRTVGGSNSLQSHRHETKELMALAIGIALHCDGCVASHTKMAHQRGAGRDEVAETVVLAVYTGGGPAAVYGGDALRAYDQFSATKP